MHNAGALLNPLIDAGIRVLIYSGEADMRKSLLSDPDRGEADMQSSTLLGVLGS